MNIDFLLREFGRHHLRELKDDGFCDLCNALERNDPNVTTVCNNAFSSSSSQQRHLSTTARSVYHHHHLPTPIVPYGYRLGRALERNTHVTTLKLDLFSAIAPHLSPQPQNNGRSGGVFDNDIDAFCKAYNNNSNVDLLLKFVETSSSLRTIDLCFDLSPHNSSSSSIAAAAGQEQYSELIERFLRSIAVNDGRIEAVSIINFPVRIGVFSRVLQMTSLRRLKVTLDTIVVVHDDEGQQPLMSIGQVIADNTSLTSLTLLCKLSDATTISVLRHLKNHHPSLTELFVLNDVPTNNDLNQLSTFVQMAECLDGMDFLESFTIDATQSNRYERVTTTDATTLSMPGTDLRYTMQKPKTTTTNGATTLTINLATIMMPQYSGIHAFELHRNVDRLVQFIVHNKSSRLRNVELCCVEKYVDSTTEPHRSRTWRTSDYLHMVDRVLSAPTAAKVELTFLDIPVLGNGHPSATKRTIGKASKCRLTMKLGDGCTTTEAAEVVLLSSPEKSGVERNVSLKSIPLLCDFRGGKILIVCVVQQQQHLPPNNTIKALSIEACEYDNSFMIPSQHLH